MGRSQGFASAPTDYTPYSDSPSLRLPPSTGLTSPVTATRRLIMQKARRHPTKGTPTACRRTVSGSLSPRCSRCFSPFPHGTGPLSVFREYLALPDGPGCFGQGFTCPALLRVPPGRSPLSRTGLSPATAGRSRPFRLAARNLLAALLPRRGRNRCGLGYSPFARHYSGNHCCFLLLRVLRCFSSPGSPPAPRRDGTPPACRVAPFGNPRITGYMRLPRAYRSLSRPSSPPEA